MGTAKTKQDLKDEFLKQGIKVGEMPLTSAQQVLVKREPNSFLSLQTHKHYFYASPNLLKE